MATTPATQKNNPANVSLGKTNVTGYAYWAPKGTALPADASTALPEAYIGLGYIGEDGITNASDSETTDVKEMGGENVLSIITSYSETYQFVLIEAMRKSAAQIRYGERNVTGEDGALSITHTMPDDTEFVLVVELALTGNKKDRFVIPRAVRKEFGDRTLSGTEVLGYDVTLGALPSDQINGGTSREYIGSATAAANTPGE